MRKTMMETRLCVAAAMSSDPAVIQWWAEQLAFAELQFKVQCRRLE